MGIAHHCSHYTFFILFVKSALVPALILHPQSYAILTFPMNTSRAYTVALAWIGVFAFRFFLLPFRAPNVEPILSVLMPVGTRMGMLASVAFAVSSIVVYDAFTAGWGSWTLAAALAYALVAILAALYFRVAPSTRAHFVGFSIGATLLYDALTGLTVGPLIFGQPFAAALYGQIPFTLMHLAGAVLFAAVVSPALDRALAAQEQTASATAPVHA